MCQEDMGLILYGLHMALILGQGSLKLLEVLEAEDITQTEVNEKAHWLPLKSWNEHV